MQQQVWDPLSRLQPLVFQQITVIFYTEPTGLLYAAELLELYNRGSFSFKQFSELEGEPHQKLQNPTEINHILHLIQA